MKNRIKIICLSIASLTLAGMAGVMLDANHPNVVQATDASTYYGSAIDWTATGATLKSALHDKIESHTAGSYAGLWEIYKTSDIDADGKIWDIYSKCHFTVTTDQCGTYSVEGDCYNREHLIPQSVFNKSSPMVCDAHHIYPTDGKVNGMRSDYPHGFVSSATYTSGNGSKLGTGNSTYGYTSTCFEPIDDYKGDVARAYFYFVTAYQEKVSGYSFASFSTDAYPSLATWAIKTYLKWAYDDPVSQKEIDRNNAIYAIQGNRNPYVDHPEAAARVWDPNNTYGFFNTHGTATSSTTPTISMPSTLSIDVGSTGSAAASVTNYTGSVTYSSGDTGVATVDSSGLVSGVSAGTATITGSFTSDGTTYSDTCAVTVNAVTPRITLGQSTISLTVGGSAGSVSFTTANFSSTPTVTVSGGDTSIATVSVGTSSITITPVAAGTLNLTVTATSGSQSGTASLAVTVAAAPVVGESVTITASSTNVPSTYSTSTSALTIEGLSLVAYNVGTSYSSGYIQFKGSSGYISNSTALSKPIASIVITYKSSVTTSPTTVSFGTSSSSLSAGTSSGNGTVWTYTPSGSDPTFFKILEGGSAGYVASIVINYASSSATLSSIAVTTQPTKTTYYVGDTFSSAGLVITGTYSDSTTKTITGYTLSTPDMTSDGPATVTVTYNGLTTSFDITINPVELSSIAITTAATTTSYYVGQTLSLSGLVVTASYNNGNTAAVTSYTTSPAAGTELTSAGTQSVTISYTEDSITKTTAYSITVNAVELASIAVTAPTKTTYTVNETLDTTGMVVTASYNNGSSAAVTGYTTDPANGATLSSTGNQNVTVSYTEGSVTKTGSFAITVNGAQGSVTLSSIEVTTQPTKTVYTVGDTFDTTGLVVTAAYSDSTTADVTSSCTLNPLNGATLSTAGSQTVVVSYNSLTTNFAVTVNAAATSDSTTYTLVSSTSDLVSGAKYVIASSGTDGSVSAMSSTQNANNRGIEAVTVSSSKLTATTTIEQLTLGGDATNGWSFYANQSSTNGYLFAASSSNNYLRTQTTNDSNGLWTIAISSNAATITAKGTNTRNMLRWNSTSSIFSCYSSGQAAVYLYKQASSSSNTSATDASYWAATFVTTMSGICANTQANSTASTSLVNAWASQYSAYSSLSSAAKTLVASTTTTDTNIQAAQAKYIYILNKYGTASFTSGNYLGLTISSGAYVGVTKADSSESVAILVVSLMLAAGLASFYFLRKKKAI